MYDINNILQQGEGLNIEFKSTFNIETIETLTAFANTKGGAVFVGIADNKDILGMSLSKETLQQWLNEIKNKTEPSIIPDIEIEIFDEKTVVILSIREFPVKPVACRGKYFKRKQNSNHKLTPAEISDVYMHAMQSSWDAYPRNGETFGSLNELKIKQFIAKVNLASRFLLPENPKEALLKLRMLNGDVPTNAAMLLFSKDNLWNNVHIGRFKTPSTIIADKLINGNLFDILEESMQTIIGHLKFAFEITGKTTQRTEIAEYPLDAFEKSCLMRLFIEIIKIQPILL